MPIQEKTICYSISMAMGLLERVLKTNELDVTAFGELLHDIRTMAYSMEHGLELRKEIMIENSLEEEYKKRKGERDTPKGVNKLTHAEEKRKKEEMDFEITIKEKGEIIYQGKSYGALFCNIEEINDIDGEGLITGKTQRFFLGHPLAVFFGFDQLRQAYESKELEIKQALKVLMKNNNSMDKETKDKLLRAMNGK